MSERSWLQRAGYNVLRRVCQVAGAIVFQIRGYGREHYPESGGALICANHQSTLDPVLVGLTCRRRMNYLARKTLFDSRLFRMLIEFLDAIPIDRDGFGLAGIKETLKRLKRGELVLVFPEGTRTPDGEVQALKPGICSLARRGRVPLVPVGIDGAYQAWPRGAKLPRPRRIRVVVGRPIQVAEIDQRDDDQLLALLQERMAECHRQAREHCRPTCPQVGQGHRLTPG